MIDSAAESVRASKVARALEGALAGSVVGFACWTVGYHLAVGTGAPQWAATAIAAGVAALTGLVWTGRPRRPTTTPGGREGGAGEEFFAPPPSGAAGDGASGGSGFDTGQSWATWCCAAGAVLVSIGRLGTVGWRAGWAALVVGFVAALWQTKSIEPPDRVAPRQRGTCPRSALVVLALALCWAGASAVTSRPDSDDTYLVNRSLWVAENPDAAFPTGDTMLSDQIFDDFRPDVTPSSIEPLVGVLARILGVHAATLTYLGLGPFAAGLAVAAMWRLLVSLGVRWPLVHLVVALGFLLLDGQRHQGFGNFGFVRSWQGKAVLVAVLVPAVWAWSLDLGRALTSSEGPERGRSIRRLVVLVTAANVAAIGLSSSGIMIVPTITVVVVAVAAGLKRPARLLAVVGGAVAYPVVAFLAWSDVERLVEFAASSGSLDPIFAFGRPGGVLAVESALDVGEGSSRPWRIVVGTGLASLVGASGVGLAWRAVPDRDARRALIVVPLVLLLVFLGPGSHDTIQELTRADSVYWRVLWLVPVPVMVALVLLAPATCIRGRTDQIAHPSLTATRSTRGESLGLWGSGGLIAVSIVLLLAAGAPVLAADNAEIGAPAWDLERDRREPAELLLSLAEPGDVIGAPQEVSQVLPILSVEVTTLVPEDRFVRGRRREQGFHLDERRQVTRVLSEGLGSVTEPELVGLLDLLSVDVVCADAQLADGQLVLALGDAGFVDRGRDEVCNYWSRA